jgi:DNA-binding response OmpR family regulator
MNTLLVIEDERRVADVLKRGLEEAGFAVSLAYDGEAGLKLFRSTKFDMVISDIMLPEMSGLEVCKEIRKTDSNIPILMLTALGETDDKLDGFYSGADDYMVKPFDIRELEARINVLLKRKSTTGAQPETLHYADLNIDLRTHTVTRNGQNIKLTPKEFNLLQYMVRHSERILTRNEIAENVWNTHFDTGTNFIDVYINYLRKKVDKNFSVKLIHTKPGIGFIFQSKHDD